MMATRRRRQIGLAALTSLALAITACGGSSGNSTGTTSAATSAAATSAASAGTDTASATGGASSSAGATSAPLVPQRPARQRPPARWTH